MKVLFWFLVTSLAFALAIGAVAEGPDGEAAAKPEAARVSVSADGTKVTEVLQSIAQQGSERVIVESFVKGDVTLSLNDKSFEDALSTVCKSCKLDWRKVYVGRDSKIVEQPDRLAATVRLVTSMTYPDLIVAGASNSRIGMFATDQESVGKFDDKMASELGLIRVYLVSDDAKVAAKVAEKDKEKKADESINDYLKKTKEQMEAFMKMTPEQQEQAMLESLNAADQVPLDYTAMAMRAMMRLDPELMRETMSRQSQAAFDAMFSMPQEQRRAFFRMQMQMGAGAMSSMTPEQQQMLMDDVMAIQQETGGEQQEEN